MIALLKFIRNNKKYIISGLFFIGAIMIIFYIIPKKPLFKYEFQKGNRWNYPDLSAPFDFPLYKSDAEIATEKDTILKSFIPYYTYDASITQKQLSHFQEKFREDWIAYSLTAFNINNKVDYENESKYASLRNLHDHFSTILYSLLEQVYIKGIIDFSDYETKIKSTISSVILIKGNIAEEKEITDLYISKSAYDLVIQNLDDEINASGKKYVRKYIDFFKKFDINQFIQVNIFYSDEKSETAKNELIKKISPTKNMISEGELVVRKGELITPAKFEVVSSLKYEWEHEYGKLKNNYSGAGYFIIIMLAMLLLYLFLFNYRKEIFEDYKKVLFILLQITIMVIVVSTVVKSENINLYVVPVCILPILIRIFYDVRTAMFTFIITVLLIGAFVVNRFEFVFLTASAGIISIYSLTNFYRRSKFIITAMLVVLVYFVTYFAFAIIQEGTIDEINWRNFTPFALNGFLILLAFPLVYIFEKTFGFLTDATLMELSDTNQPLLRKLAENAPGTFQHSLQVANLAEDAIREIGGNPLLVRVGALYHDIGKMRDPIYFIENQRNGINPHDLIEFFDSAGRIISHVPNGVELARKHNLPEPIIFFILTHHGKTTVQYFYKSYIKKYPDQEVDVNKFTYPGPKPFSKETVVLMMADAVEAASRSLSNINESSISEVVDRIIDKQQSTGQYEHSDITFKDISKIKEIFKKRLGDIYHIRIEYPK